MSGTRNSRNETTTNGYDNLGRLSTATDTAGATRKYLWDPASQLVGVVDPLGHATALSYDPRGRLSTVTYADTTSTTRTYFPDGELKSITDEVGRKTTFGVDSAGHVTSIVDPTGAAEMLGYDDDGRVISRKDRLGQETKYGFDGLGRLATLTRPDGTAYTTTYDLAGNLVALQSAKGGTWIYGWDANRRLKSKKDPLGNESRYDYHANGLLKTVDEPAESGARLVTTMDYDALRRPTAIVTPDRALTISYDDAAHAVHIVIAPDGIVIDRTMDALSRIVRETTTSSITTTLQYGWDAASNLKTVTQNGVLVLSLDYDARNRATKIRDERRGRNFTFSYTKSGELQTATYPSGVTKNQVWGSRGELQAIEFRTSGGVLLLRRAYGYDANLQITQVSSEAGSLVAYGYSSLGQIKSANYADGDFEAWNYDGNGNISSYQHGPSSETRTHDDADQLARIDATSGAAVSALYVHDPRGNVRHRITSTQDREYMWDAEGHLRVVQVNGQTQLKAHYLEGAQLESLETPADGVTVFSMSFGNILSEFQGGVEATFNVGQPGLDRPLDRGPPTGPSQTLASDHVESVLATLDEGGNLLSAQSYAAYGVSRLGADPGKIGFAGARRDPGTGLVNLRNRWLDPQIGRFLSRDPIGFSGGSNLYAYVHNNPVGRRDPNGLFGAGELEIDPETLEVEVPSATASAVQATHSQLGIPNAPSPVGPDPVFAQLVNPYNKFFPHGPRLGVEPDPEAKPQTPEAIKAILDRDIPVDFDKLKTNDDPKDPYYHYSTPSNIGDILISGYLKPSCNGPNARYGNGQYFTDIAPETVGARRAAELAADQISAGQISYGQLVRRLYGNPYGHLDALGGFLELDLQGLPVVNPAPHIFLVPNNKPLDLSGRVVRFGLTPFGGKRRP